MWRVPSSTSNQSIIESIIESIIILLESIILNIYKLYMLLYLSHHCLYISTLHCLQLLSTGPTSHSLYAPIEALWKGAYRVLKVNSKVGSSSIYSCSC